jgi:hypothetical protein
MTGTGYRAGGNPFATRRLVAADPDDDDVLATPGSATGGEALPPLVDDEEDEEGVARIGGNPAAAPRPTSRPNVTGCAVIAVVLIIALALMAGVAFLGYVGYTAWANQTPAPTAKPGAATPTRIAPTATPAKGQVVVKDVLSGSELEVTDLCGNKFKTTVPPITNGKNIRRTIGSVNCGIVVEFQPSQ